MKILFIGDIVGRPGRTAVKNHLKKIIEKYDIDVCIANGENSAGGSGITQRIADELVYYGIDLITTGDHIWRNKDVFSFISKNDRVLKPANYPEETPGRGHCFFQTAKGINIGVINLLGRVFMKPVDCPFKTAKRLVADLKKNTNIIIVDFHAEATSEKVAMGWFLDGDVSAVLGTHTHIPTADYKILTNGTAYISDVGMVGAEKSVLGRDIEPVIKHFTSSLPSRFTIADGKIIIQSVIIEIDEQSGSAKNISRLEYP
ncbi:TIGR00282 family metallophosphoesterase [bacterium]|nr:TIGR00282 family metallophosphoesterase [bacterium]